MVLQLGKDKVNLLRVIKGPKGDTGTSGSISAANDPLEVFAGAVQFASTLATVSYVLTGNGDGLAPTWQKLNLASTALTGPLPSSYGGTGSTTAIVSLTTANEAFSPFALRTKSTVATSTVAVAGFKMGASSIGIYFGTSTPTAIAPQGSLYLNTGGSSSVSRLYINSNSSAGWIAIMTTG